MGCLDRLLHAGQSLHSETRQASLNVSGPCFLWIFLSLPLSSFPFTVTSVFTELYFFFHSFGIMSLRAAGFKSLAPRLIQGKEIALFCTN